MKLVEYEVLGASEIKHLEDVVNSAIKDGMLPIGGVAVSESYTSDWDANFHYTFLQAMGRYESTDVNKQDSDQ